MQLADECCATKKIGATEGTRRLVSERGRNEQKSVDKYWLNKQIQRQAMTSNWRHEESIFSCEQRNVMGTDIQNNLKTLLWIVYDVHQS